MKALKEKTICLITPNKDTFSNPTLLELFRQFGKYNYEVILMAPPQSVPLSPEFKHVTIQSIPFPSAQIPKRPRSLILFLLSYWKAWNTIREHKINRIFAVDPIGIIVAGRIVRFLRNYQLTYVSFEIFFQDEIQPRHLKLLKKKEVKYLRYAKNVIIQDEKRKDLFIKENKTSPNELKFFLVPVAPKKQKIPRSLPSCSFENKITLIHSGTVHYWSGISILIETLKLGIPKNFHFFIHSRYPLNKQNPIHAELENLQMQGYPLTLHDEPFSDYSEYCNFLSKFDIGLAFYQPDFKSIYTGKNIETIGLASGKFSTYMMLGIPTITTNQHTFNHLNQAFNFGWNIDNARSFSELLKTIKKSNLKDLKKNCKVLYESELEPESRISFFLRSEMPPI